MKDNETQLVKACLTSLDLLQIPAWRNNTGAVVSIYKGKKRVIKYGHPGSGDILGVIPPYGRALSVECKMPGKKPTDQQDDFAKMINHAGGLAVVVYTPEELEDIIRVTYERYR